METIAIIKIILQFIGGAVIVMSVGVILLYLCFYKGLTIDDLIDEHEKEIKELREMREDPGTLTIDQLLEQ